MQKKIKTELSHKIGDWIADHKRILRSFGIPVGHCYGCRILKQT